MDWLDHHAMAFMALVQGLTWACVVIGFWSHWFRLRKIHRLLQEQKKPPQA